MIAFLDADDIWLPGKLTAQVAYLRNTPRSVWSQVISSCGSRNPTALLVRHLRPRMIRPLMTSCRQHSGWIYGELLCDCIVCTITVMIRKSVVNTVGFFNEQLRTGEDYEYWFRVSRHVQATKLNQDFACYRIHPQSITQVPRPKDNEYHVLQDMLGKFGPVGPDGSQVPAARLARPAIPEVLQPWANTLLER